MTGVQTCALPIFRPSKDHERSPCRSIRCTGGRQPVTRIDAPGYGYAKVNKQLKNKFGLIMEDYLEGRDNLKMVFLLVDFRHKPTDDDVMMYNYLKHYNIPVTVVCTKMDKVTKKNQDKNLKLISKTLGVEQQELIPFSTITKVGKQEIYNKLMEEIEL